jgi:ligand-binding sensor domain-containing protein/two-component sensor histidine kinase
VRIASLYLLLHFSLFVKAQPSTVYFRNLNTGNGLSHNKVNCIIQDRRGFTWIGTDDGLNRYDGYRFQVFRHDPTNPVSISGNIITDLLEDKNGLLWIATADGGLTRYDYRLDPRYQFRQYKHSTADSMSIPLNMINALIEDRDGFLWLATSGHGVLRFDKQKEIFAEPLRRRSRTYLDLAIGHDGKIWAGRQGGGLIKIDPRTLSFEEDQRYTDVYAKLPHMTVAAIFRDSKNNMWLGSWDKVVYKVNTQQQEQVYAKTSDPFSFPGDDPLAFAEDRYEQIWIGGQYNGLYSYHPASQKFYHYRHDPAREGSLADNQVNCIFIDHSDIVWIGTTRGISIYNPLQQKFVQNFLPGANGHMHTLYDFYNDSRFGHLMIGSSRGIYTVDSKSTSPQLHTLVYKGEKLAVTSFFSPAGNELYIGTNVSLFRLNQQDFTVAPLPNTEKDIVMKRIIESRVVSIVADTIDAHPVLLVSPYGHYLAYYDFVLQQWVSRQDSVRDIIKNFNIKDNLVRKFFKAGDGTIWLATAKFGLGEWIAHSLPSIRYYYNTPGDEKSISNNNVYDIAEDVKGNFWVTTYGGGLHFFDRKTKTFRHITASHNLAEGVQLDEKGNVWMIANGNLHKYDPYHESYTTYQLPDLEKTGGVKGYIFRDRDGKFFVAGNNYFISFYPHAIKDLSTQPKVFLTDFKIFNTSYSQLLFEKQIRLRYNQNFFSLEYAAPVYQAGYPVQYAHKLEGVDHDWVHDGTRNVINYTNLDDGEYEFKVRATIKPGIWGEDIASVRIRINPPFWKTWWFYSLSATLISLVVYVIYHYRINELLKRQAIRNKIAQDLHDNVGSTLSSISVYSQVAKIYKEQNKMDPLQETLEKISTTSSEMISEMNDIVWAINPRNDNMATILQRMESFALPLLASQEIKLHFSYEMSVQHQHLEMNKRKNFYLIFKEATNNALKYSACKNLWVEIGLHHHQLLLTVRDDGRGFDTKKAKSTASLSGNGVQNMQMRAAEMKGHCTIESEPGKGTVVKLSFPIP